MIGERLGRALRGLSPGAFARFLQVPADADVETAQRLAREAGAIGGRDLGKELRNELARRISRRTLRAGLDRAVGLALRRSRAVAEATGTDGEELLRGRAQEKELARLERVFAHIEELLLDGRRVLAAWQAQARERALSQLFLDLTDPSIPVAERRQLLDDAAAVLDLLEKELKERVQMRSRALAEHGQREQELAKLDLDIETLKAMRDIRRGAPPDEADLQRLAAHYARYSSGAGG